MSPPDKADVTVPLSQEEHPSSPKRLRRSVVACLKCRERKVRCSGTHPCVNCTRRNVDCSFEQEDRKVTVSENYLNQLKRKASALNDQDVARQSMAGQSVSAHSPDPLDDGHDVSASANELGDSAARNTSSRSSNKLPPLRNPLMTMPVNFLTDGSGRRRFLGPSSTWAYTQYVMGIIRTFLTSPDSPNVPLNVDGTARPLDLPSVRNLGQTVINKESLPSLDYALYLVNTVKFHVSQTYHIFEEASFMRNLYSLYNDEPQPTDQQSRLAYIQYLVVMALGKALLNRNTSGSRHHTAPSGSEYFVQALELFPDVTGLYANPVMAVEICSAVALYMQSVDHRNSAYVYLGLGLRLALTQGLHRDLNAPVEESDRQRHHNAWWTLYVLDRKFSSLMGAPTSVQDCDISVPLPDPHQSVRSAALSMHVKLSRLIAEVLNTVYGIDGRLNTTFLPNLQSILRKLAALAAELTASPELKINNSGAIGRVSATLNLCYHQCIVLATRPLLVTLLRQKLEQKSRDVTATGSGTSREVSNPIRALLRTSYDSAKKSLRILEMLRDQDLLEMFLPFDLDHVFSSGLVLTLFSALQPFPEASVDDSHFFVTLGLLNALIMNGNATANFRCEELERLNEMLNLAALEGRNNGQDIGSDVAAGPSEHAATAPDDQLAVGTEGYLEVMGQGVSPDQWLTVASLLSDYPPMVDMVPDMMDTSWMWQDGDGHLGEGS